LANLLAVPVVTFLVVPLGMLGMGLWLLSPALGGQHLVVGHPDHDGAGCACWRSSSPGLSASIDWSLPGQSRIYLGVAGGACAFGSAVAAASTRLGTVVPVACVL
jgi:hypothetical protein